MPSTYIDLCNQVLRRLNEVEITQTEFADVRGVHALVKDAVKAGIAKINQAEFTWPFNLAEFTQVLTKGQTEYTWPTGLKKADYNTFQLQKNDTLGIGFTTLTSIDTNEWYSTHRDPDYEAGAAGRAVPTSVFAVGTGFGVTPSPNEAYSIKFRYYLNYTNLVNFSDVTRIPESFDTVIIDGALYHMYMFKDNLEAAGAAYSSLQQGLKDLQTLFINNYEYIRDSRVSF